MSQERVKHEFVPGTRYTEVEFKTAELLDNTYRVEVVRHKNNQQTLSTARKPRKYARLADPRKMQEERPVEDDCRDLKEVEFWIQLARTLIKARIDPAEFVRSQFYMISAADHPPGMHALASQKCFDRYEQSRELAVREITSALRFQAECLQREVSMAQNGNRSPQAIWETILTNELLSLSPLFRYCLALNLARSQPLEHRDRFRNIARHYERHAALQYIYNKPIYDTVWGPDWIPAGFAARGAEKIYRDIFMQGAE
jgi:hypothetical protein